MSEKLRTGLVLPSSLFAEGMTQRSRERRKSYVKLCKIDKQYYNFL